jgi:hypothetical protein
MQEKDNLQSQQLQQLTQKQQPQSSSTSSKNQQSMWAYVKVINMNSFTQKY